MSAKTNTNTVETTDTNTILTTSEVAAAFGCTPRELRVFLRSASGMNARVGSGKRWGIAASDLDALRKRYEARGGGKGIVVVNVPTESDHNA